MENKLRNKEQIEADIAEVQAAIGKNEEMVNKAREELIQQGKNLGYNDEEMSKLLKGEAVPENTKTAETEVETPPIVTTENVVVENNPKTLKISKREKKNAKDATIVKEKTPIKKKISNKPENVTDTTEDSNKENAEVSKSPETEAETVPEQVSFDKISPEKTEEENAIQKDIEKVFDAEQNKKDDAEINIKLKSIGLNEDYFKDNLDWQNFSKAEKLLIIEQASQNTLSHVKELGEKRFAEENTIQRSWNPSKWKWSSIRKTWNNLSKSYWISKAEKNIISEVEEGKIKPEEKALDTLIERQRDLGLSVIEKDGKAFIEFARRDENLSEEQKIIIEKFNQTANNFSKIPDSWKNERSAKSTDKMFSGDKKNHEKFEEVKAEYEKEKAALMKDLQGQYEAGGMSKVEAKEKAMLGIKDIDYMISMLQFTNTNPDAFDELKKIRTESSWGRLLNNENIWRAGYMTAGYTARTLTSTIGWITAPITAGVIGGVRARRKANESIDKSFNEGRKEETFLERREAGKKKLFDNKNDGQGALSYLLQGEKVNTKEVAAFIDADSQKQRIDNLVNKINNAKEDSEKASLMAQLEARLQYIELKQSQGLVNYGKENPTVVNYELFKTMSEAYVVSTTIDNLGIPLTREMNEDLRERDALLANIMARNEVTFGKNIASHKNAEMIRGALVGAGFAALGGLIREWMHGDHIQTAIAPVGATSHGVDAISGPDIRNIQHVIEHTKPIEITAGKGDGAIVLFRHLKKSLELKYGDHLEKATDLEKHILSTDENHLAMENNMFKPGEDAESLRLQPGDKLVLDNDTQTLTFHEKLINKDILLEKGAEIKTDHVYDEKMFDSDHSAQVHESFKVPEQVDPTTGKPLHEIIQGEGEQINPENGQYYNDYINHQINPENGQSMHSLTENQEPVNPEAGNVSKPFHYTHGIHEAVKLNNETAVVYSKNISHLFPGKNIKVWGDAKNLSVEKFMQLAKKKELNEVYLPLFAHIKKLEHITKLTPEYSNQIKPSETIQNYIARAMKRAEDLGKLRKVTLVRDSEVFKVSRAI